MAVVEKPVIRMQDIAQLAGVSIFTVSKVLNGETNKDSAVYRQVMEIVNETGYRRIRQRSASGSAPKIKGNKSRTGNIALMAREEIFLSASLAKDGFHSGAINCIQHFAEERGFNMVLSSLKGHDHSVPAIVQDKRVDGVIWFSGYNAQTVIAINKLIPLVILNNAMSWPPMTSVLPDYGGSLLPALDHLQSLGHRRIGFFLGKKPPGPLQDISILPGEEIAGFKAAIDHFDLDADPALIHCPAFEKAEHLAAMAGAVDYFLSLKPRPTALVAGLVYVVAILNECRNRHVRVPEDLSLVAMDESGVAQMMDPPLTTLAAGYDECGRMAADLLFEKMANPGSPPRTVRIAPRLIVRQSTAQAPNNKC